MAFEFKLPDIGEGVVEGEIVKWLVKEGDVLEEDQPMVEVMTDKATVTIPSPRKGKVLKTVGREGETVKVGATMVVIEEEGMKAETAKAETAKPERPAEPPRTGDVVKAPEVRKAPEQAPESRAMKEGPRTGKVLATPATRKLARELGVDLSNVAGTGPQGRVTKDDLQKFATGPQPTPLREVPRPTAPTAEERVPFRGLRRKIAERMVKSKHTAPHFTYVEEVDMTELVSLRKQAASIAEEQRVKLTYLPFIIKALIVALKQYPWLNSTLDEEREEVVLKKYYNIGMAVATPNGLIVPVIKNADQKNILELAKELERLSAQAREGTAKLEDLQGSTFTITSMGPLGGIFATPIINYPEVAILGVHRIHQRPVVRNDQIVIRDMMYLSLSFDHRIIDGAVGAEFARYLIRFLENPNLLFMQMV